MQRNTKPFTADISSMSHLLCVARNRIHDQPQDLLRWRNTFTLFFYTPNAPTTIGRPPTVGTHVLSMTLTTPRRSNSLPIRFMDRARPDGHLLVNPAKTQSSTLQWATQLGRAEPSEDPRSRLKQSQEVPSNFPEGSATEASTPHFHQTHLFAGSVTSRSQVQLLRC